MTNLQTTLTVALAAIRAADNQIFRIGGHGALSVQLVQARDLMKAAVAEQTTTYTVLLQRPDYVAANYGEDDFMWQGEAGDSIEALEFARTAAIEADGGEEVCDVPTDYRCLILLAGIHDNINPEIGQ